MNTGIPPTQTLPLTFTKLAVSPGFLKDLPFPFRSASSYPRENSYFPYLEKNCNYSTVRPHNRKMTSASVLRNNLLKIRNMVPFNLSGLTAVL